ncbi:MAG: sugar phosphate isomerase/epimerase [Chloroflexi bacterium]|nr:sugar phosphate isomerase/epimerase [Chloroflexota bacterium]
MAAPLALQLYTLRDSLAVDFAGGIRRVAEAGYLGVETAGFKGTTVQEAVRLFQEHGLEVVSAHSALPLDDQKNEVLDTMAALGCKRLVCPWLPPEEFVSRDSIRRACDRLNQADAVARENSLTLLYHNHWFEPAPVDGTPAYQIMIEYLEPTVLFEIDTYWVKVGGLDPAAVVRELGSRAPLLHIKDGPAVDKDQPMVAVGAGALDWPSVIEAAVHADWLIVELDRCATDMWEAVVQSYHYLTGKGYARGRQG